MRIQSTKLFNLRRFESFSLEDFNPRLNIIVGPNAHGKTSILESLSLITSLKSFKTSRASELIRGGQTEASVKAQISHPTQTEVLIGLGNEGRERLLKVDGQSLSRSKYPYLGTSISFVPDDLQLVKGSPEARRNWLDDLGLSLDRDYDRLHTQFEHSLKQRNRLLKALKNEEIRSHDPSLPIWNEAFVENAIPLIQKRSFCVQKLNQLLPRLFSNLFGSSEEVSVSYESCHYKTSDRTGKGRAKTSVGLPTEIPAFLPSAEELRKILFADIERVFEGEKAMGYSLVGPQRDDLRFQLDSMDARDFASQGQIRGLVIALKIAQLELSREHRQSEPILLLDDIISELDDSRTKALVHFLSNYSGQLFVTTAEVSKVQTLHQEFAGFRLIDLSATSHKQILSKAVADG